MTPAWRLEDDGEPLLTSPASAETDLVSLRFLIAAARRRWRVVAACVVVGLVLALGALHHFGGAHTATTTLYLTSPPDTDPATAMVTNQSLLGTRAVSQEAVSELELPMTPEAFRETISEAAPSSELMSISVAAPTDADATRRADVLAAIYLKFRADQLSSYASSSADSDQQLVDSLTQQIDDLTTRYDDVANTPGKAGVANALLAQRTTLESQLTTAKLNLEQTQLQNQAVINASHIVDPAAIVHVSQKKKIVLTVMSGLIGGLGLGLAIVLTPAIVSSRLRRREDVARALGIPVRFSAGRVRPRLLRPRRAALRQAQRLAHGLATALPESGTSRLTVATVGDVRDGAYVLGALADELAAESTRVSVVDLTTSGALYRRTLRTRLGLDPVRNRQLVHVHRHDVRVTELGSVTRRRVTSESDMAKAEFVLTLIELDLGTGVESLGDLADVSVVLVTAGKATAERLRSSAILLRQAGLRPEFTMLVGADETDESSGLFEAGRTTPTAVRKSS